jgi:hypothetical protein
MLEAGVELRARTASGAVPKAVAKMKESSMRLGGSEGHKGRESLAKSGAPSIASLTIRIFTSANVTIPSRLTSSVHANLFSPRSLLLHLASCNHNSPLLHARLVSFRRAADLVQRLSLHCNYFPEDVAKSLLLSSRLPRLRLPPVSSTPRSDPTLVARFSRRASGSGRHPLQVMSSVCLHCSDRPTTK